MQDRSSIIEMKQMLKLLQQINSLQIQNDEPDKLNIRDSNDDEIINDIEIILNLDEDQVEQTEKDDKLSENETISNEHQQQTSKQNIIEQRKAVCRVVFNPKNNSYRCSICQTTYKVLKNLLNHQYRFHNKPKKGKHRNQKLNS
ncbi:unnamed protein product [Paramecium pentaurelia]|uniref:C2H2-type domain-containing protein n=1 Tax=Paramecium pentaurelia TaxID=43138 RepID=A0A8S1WN07_9CILI|nr:unnamed protein product [Paramecium pentaurelia]